MDDENLTCKINPKKEQNIKAILIAFSAIMGVAIVVAIMVGVYFIVSKKTATANNVNGPQFQNENQLINQIPATNKPKLGATLPFTITANDRLIVRISASNSFQSNYYIYKYPVGTFASLSDLINALNTSSNWEAVFFDSTNKYWVLNAYLVWGQSLGKLTFTWTDTAFDQIMFYKIPPTDDPLFAVPVGQGGINDSIVLPNYDKFIDSFGMNTTTIYSTGETITLSFP